jgi:hypothetical protein
MVNEKYQEMNKINEFIDLKNLPVKTGDEISLKKCRVIFDEQGLEHMKGINSLKIKAGKIYATQKALAMLYNPNIKLPKYKISNNFIQVIEQKSRL